MIPDYTPRNDTTAFILTTRITHGDATVNQIAQEYRLPKLREVVAEYFERRNEGGLRIKLLDCWDRVRLQIRTCDASGPRLTQPIPVMAMAPSLESPSGLCNFVLVKALPDLLDVACFQGIKSKQHLKFVD